ncbi:hypothetical protein [Photobacterium leiognathi]|uniref:hypothetical protein n=1 Tax=Photobacterium leiognathi TaxID=553611 RepID=UPI0029827DCF|nr:hypothetical protein [Photobacterium leiognathi]
MELKAKQLPTITVTLLDCCILNEMLLSYLDCNEQFNIDPKYAHRSSLCTVANDGDWKAVSSKLLSRVNSLLPAILSTGVGQLTLDLNDVDNIDSAFEEYADTVRQLSLDEFNGSYENLVATYPLEFATSKIEQQSWTLGELKAAVLSIYNRVNAFREQLLFPENF